MDDQDEGHGKGKKHGMQNSESSPLKCVVKPDDALHSGAIAIMHARLPT